MSSTVSGPLPADPAQKMQIDYEQLQRSTIRFTLPGLFIAALLLGATTTGRPDYAWALATGLGLLGLIPLLWFLSRSSFLLASLVLIVGSLAAVYSVVILGGISSAVFLLIVPVGLTCVSFGALPGAAVAALCSLLALLAPGSLSRVDPSLRAMTALGVWATTGMIWLTLRPLLTSADWSWKAYKESQALLEESREYQVRLRQALDDLTNANTQLNRLNLVANNLRRAAEDERRIKEQFVANVSHELRTPLNMIIGFSEMILKAPETYGQKVPTNLLADLQVVLRNSQHLSSLIDDVLDLSQIEAGQMALVKEWVSIDEIFQAVTIAVRPLYESKGLYLETSQEEGLPDLYCDRTRIREVLLNLLSNAGRFTEQGGVKVKAWKEGGSVLFSVADTGPGISDEDKQRLFQPFQQLDATIRRKHGGTGLGLSISKSFVEMHDGKMWVESEKGQGTTFYFRLPFEPPSFSQGGFARWVNPYTARDRRVRLSDAPLVDTRSRVLVVEPGSVFQRLLKRYMADMEISSVPDFEAARAEMERSPARLVLVNNPAAGRTRFDPDQVASLPFNTPVIACSIADPLQSTVLPEIPLILVKPISRDALLGILEKVGSPIRTILLVDDELDAQKLFVRMLNSAGRDYRVLRAGNGLQALSVLARQKVDVILLDLVMPEMDGFQFLKVKEQDPAIREIPVVLISARDPRGQPIVSSYLTAARSGGLSIQQLLDCIRALGAILAPGNSDQRSAVSGQPDRADSPSS